MAIWKTSAEAIAEAAKALVGSGLKGIDYSKVRTQGTNEALQVRREAYATVMAAVGAYSVLERRILVGHALGMSYRELAKALDTSDRTVRRLHHPAYDAVDNRLISLGLVEEGNDPQW